jgi:hypothetical protein
MESSIRRSCRARSIALILRIATPLSVTAAVMGVASDARAADEPATELEAARAQEARGLLIEARDGYLRVARMSPAAGEPPTSERARMEATELGARIADRIPSVTISVKGPPPGSLPTVTIDGVEVPQGSLVLPRKVNPGRHAVVAKLAGYKAASAEVDLKEGDSQSVDLALVVDPDAPKAVVVAPTESAPQPLVLVPSNDDATDRSTAFFRWGVGVGAAGVAVGSVFGLLSISRAGDAKKNCTDDRCTPDAQSDIDSSVTLANVANVAFGVALIGAGIAVYGLVTRPAARSRSALQVTPILGPGAAGLRGTF